jgi:hypothetical protein
VKLAGTLPQVSQTEAFLPYIERKVKAKAEVELKSELNLD